MFSGAQISLYPMTGDFVAVITQALAALAPYRDRLRIETDDISTLLVGPPEVLFPAMRDLYAHAAQTGAHVVLHATISRGCPGEPDDPICETSSYGIRSPLADRKAAALTAIADAPDLGQEAAAQLSLYVMGAGDHMEEIYGCIDFLKSSGTFDRSKNFCTRLRGDSGPVFAAIQQALCSFGPPNGHVTIDLIVSANSPSTR